MTWDTSCIDWENRLVNRQSIIPPPIFPEEASKALAVFKELRIGDMPGKPTMGEVCLPWVFDFVAAVFGAYDEESGRQMIREAFLLVSKKNSKSTLSAGIMMTALIRNWRPSGEFIILAPTIEVASNSYGPAQDMVKADEELDDLFQVQPHLRTITHRNTNATLKVVAADDKTVSGKKAIIVLKDELWLLGKNANAENMLREACGGLASRPEGFTLSLSTQSDEAPAGVFKKELQYARGVRDGRIKDNKFLPVIYEFPEQMVKDKAYREKKYFYVTNPNLGASVDEEFLQREYDKAEEAGEDSMVGFEAKHLNVEVGMALKSQRWAGADFWEVQGTIPRSFGDVETLHEILVKSDVITLGGDGGGLDDLLGLAVVGRDAEDPRLWRAFFRAWAHPIALERRKSEKTKYRDFERDGVLRIVDEVGQHIEQFCEIVKICEDSGLLDRIGVDPSGIGDLVDAITELDIDHERVVGIPQGWKLNSAIKATERRLAEGKLIHGGQPMMAWCVSNARVEPKGNAIIITKQASGTGKIDPLMALLCAVALMAMNPEARGGMNIYETRGLITA